MFQVEEGDASSFWVDGVVVNSRKSELTMKMKTLRFYESHTCPYCCEKGSFDWKWTSKQYIAKYHYFQFTPIKQGHNCRCNHVIVLLDKHYVPFATFAILK